MRVALGVEYVGSQYHGWQRQPGLHTVQGNLEAALSKVADHPIELFVAGRTDTGVHSTGQVVHFDTESERSQRNWVFGANSNLPKDISVRWAAPVDETFHARFSALSRRYRYVIYNHFIRPALLHTQLTWNYRPLDEQQMQEAAEFLIGEHDFTSYRAMECQAKSPVRTIERFTVERRRDLILLDLTANGFLHHMVRNIAGVLMNIGMRRQPPLWAKEVLEKRNRTFGGITSPPYGLYLVEVKYPEEFSLPETPIGPLFLE